MAAADIYTNTGRGYVGGILAGTTTAVTTFYGNVSTDATAKTALVGDTTLLSEVGTARIVCTQTNPTTTLAGDTAQSVFTYTATGSVSIAMAAIFTALTSGVMLNESSFTAIPIVSGDSIQFTFKAQIV